MLILYLIPIVLLGLPFVAFVMISGHSARLSALEKTVAELKEKMKAGAPIPVSSVQQNVPAAPSAAGYPAQPATTSPLQKPESSSAKGTVDIISSEDSSGRILGRIGIAAVLIGVAFFLKYAFDNNWIGPAGRVMIGIIAGLGFLGVGQYIRSKYLQYSDLIMGGGIAILYLSVFSAHSFYNLIDSGTTGIFMFLVTLLAFAISITNATQTLALVSVIGAFATPTLVGSHDNAMMTLFMYMTLINVGVLGISFFKKWPRLNLASFVGTAINFMMWFGAFYVSTDMPPVLLFCIVTFLIFLVAQVARGITAGVKADEADYLLMGVNAFSFATIVYVLLNPQYHNVLGFASVLVAAIYMIVVFMVNKANPQDTALNIFLPGLAVVFLSIAVPLQFSGPWIAVAWFIEACVLYAIASVISNRGFQVMGLIVYCLGLFDYLYWYLNTNHGLEFTPFFNAPFIVLALAVVAAYLIAHIYNRYGSITAEIRQRGIVAFFIIANVLSLWALTMQITSYYAAASNKLTQNYQATVANSRQYSNGYDTRAQVDQINKTYNETITSNRNVSNTLVSILWTLYAAVLTAIGFARRMASLRRFGLVLFFVTAFKVLVDVWNLGELYRIISFIAFGVIALAVSFGYIKYKDRLKQIISLALFIGIGTAALAGISHANIAEAAFTLSDWQYARSLTVPSASGFVKAVLPTDISWTSRTGQFADVRIIDKQGNEVPYVLSQNQTSSGPTLNARLIGLTSTLSGSTVFVADMGTKATVYSSLNISVARTSTDFRSQVHVYSSDSQLPTESNAWSLVTSNGFIFRVTDPTTGATSGKYSVSIPATAARYLKIVISEGDKDPVTVTGMTAQRDIETIVGRDTMSLNATVFNDPKKKTTDVTVDLGSVGRLSDRVDLNVNPESANYIRRVVVAISDDAVNWRSNGEGSISRISTSIFNGASNYVSYQPVRARYVRLSIVNDDNPPLSVTNRVSVSVPLYAVIFQVDPGQSYVLYYGNPTALQPEYDTAQLTSYIDENNLPTATVGAETVNVAYVAPAGPVVPFTEKYKYPLNIVLVLLVVIIGGGVGWYLRVYLRTHGHSSNTDTSDTAQGGGSWDQK
ncbi:MAG TPA: DUF2339 domain-containing protein [Candidatus Paceibacterota bacterium]|nr:DUF2339 domain-containing protein [Candidatus Paceibacterota bacterium]